MNTDNNLELVKKAYEHFSSGNIPAFIELLSDEIIWVTPGPAVVPFAGTRKGKKGVLEFFSQVTATTELKKFAPVEMFTDGNKVIAIGEIDAVTLATGKSYSHKWFHEWTIENGKVINHYNFLDTLQVAESFKK